MSDDHRALTTSKLRRMYERADTAGRDLDAATLKDALHYLGADDHIAKASAMKRTADPTANALIEVMLPQLLLVLIRRLGGDVLVPVDEVDATGGLVMSMAIEGGSAFRFVVRRKAR